MIRCFNANLGPDVHTVSLRVAFNASVEVSNF